MKKTIQRSSKRGMRDHGWLQARFSFSFADYYNPHRTGFGKLLVLNDDTIAPHSGFGKHPHENMEIISIPALGEITHEDSTGSRGTIKPGQIQVMSAGSGVIHSEYNHSDMITRMFQIWIETAQPNVPPRHVTKDLTLIPNKLNKIVSGNKEEDTLFIYQDASIYLGEFDNDQEVSFSLGENKGAFIMVVEGTATIEGVLLNHRDSIELSDTKEIKMFIKGKILLIDVPMN